ncbi:MAG TPA: carbon-nitrogen family hydrolase [Geobacteraceae bacterium]|nr:carbon-nitrogen family hydrolase [Geobacteraceae bacterium]
MEPETKLTIAIAQIRVAPRKPEENLTKAESLVAEAARRGSDLVCFPEMWTTGFDWNYLAASTGEHGEVVERISELARRHRIWINGSVPTVTADGRIANTSILFDAEGGRAGVYRKVHLFSLLHEDDHLAAGDALTVVETPWGRIGLSICYDIRFPELFRSYALQGVRLVLSPSAFPHPRLDHWRVLSRARAIENQMFLVGVNRVGSEDFGPDGIVSYFGTSVLIDPWGGTVVEASGSEEELLTAVVDPREADDVRAKMRVLADRRPEVYVLS